MSTFDLNKQCKQALKLMEKGTGHVFVTGKAGSGKSTLLSHFRLMTKKKVAVLAPTGVAAVHIQGETVHSFFGFKPDITVEKVKRQSRDEQTRAQLYRELEAIVIDEVSMLRADILDCVDVFLRLHRMKNEPFGGVQMIFIGDLYQLSPIVSAEERHAFGTQYAAPYFFNAHVFRELSYDVVELVKIYRHKDPKFLELLNAIRDNSIVPAQLEVLNKRYDASFDAAKNTAVYITTTNRRVNEINDQRLSSLSEKLHRFEGEMDGDFTPSSLPTQPELFIKVGAQVMLLNNDGKGRWVNGTVGKVVAIRPSREVDALAIVVALANGIQHEVVPHSWELHRYVVEEDTKKIETEVVGRFSQYPLKLAWAITVHKSQGKTFDRIVFDVDRGTFAHGHVYVALSRATSLDGIILKQPLQKRHIIMDRRIDAFVKGLVA